MDDKDGQKVDKERKQGKDEDKKEKIRSHTMKSVKQERQSEGQKVKENKRGMKLN